MKKVIGLLFAGAFGLVVSNAVIAETVAVENPDKAVKKAEKKADKAAKKAEKKAENKNLEQIESTGTIEVTPADPAKKQKFAVITLKDGDKTFKLIPGKIKKEFSKLEQLSGKVVKVSGKLMPANEKYPMAAIKVDSFSEVQPPTKDDLKK